MLVGTRTQRLVRLGVVRFSFPSGQITFQPIHIVETKQGAIQPQNSIVFNTEAPIIAPFAALRVEKCKRAGIAAIKDYSITTIFRTSAIREHLSALEYRFASV